MILAVTCKTPKARKQLQEFLKAHYRPWSEITAGCEHLPPGEKKKDPQMYNFPSSPNKVEFDVFASVNSEEYLRGVLRFAALRVGRKKKFTLNNGLIEGVPYMLFYDQARPVLLREVWEDRIHDSAVGHLVDSTGYRPSRKPWEGPKGVYSHDRGLVAAELDAVLLGEHQRLSALWKEHCE